jgi:hypothetical protein
VLTLDGIIVTHKSGSLGHGIVVNSGGTFNLRAGEISGNYYTGLDGGGVLSKGIFNMYDGVICNNKAEWYGGVCNDKGTFKIMGGKISNNPKIP